MKQTDPRLVKLIITALEIVEKELKTEIILLAVIVIVSLIGLATLLITLL